MKIIILLLLGFAPVIGFSQPAERDIETARVKKFIQGLNNKAKVRIMLRSLSPAEGKLASSSDDSFDVKLRDPSKALITIGTKKYAFVKRIKYSDVLYIRSGDRKLDLVPDKAKRPHGTWGDLRSIYPGTRVVLIMADGKTFTGWFGSATDQAMTLMDAKAENRVNIALTEVVAFYGILGRSGGFKSGAADVSGGIPTRPGGAIIAGLGALVGGALGELLENDGYPVLVYSK